MQLLFFFFLFSLPRCCLTISAMTKKWWKTLKEKINDKDSTNRCRCSRADEGYLEAHETFSFLHSRTLLSNEQRYTAFLPVTWIWNKKKFAVLLSSINRPAIINLLFPRHCSRSLSSLFLFLHNISSYTKHTINYLIYNVYPRNSKRCYLLRIPR